MREAGKRWEDGKMRPVTHSRGSSGAFSFTVCAKWGASLCRQRWCQAGRVHNRVFALQLLLPCIYSNNQQEYNWLAGPVYTKHFWVKRQLFCRDSAVRAHNSQSSLKPKVSEWRFSQEINCRGGKYSAGVKLHVHTKGKSVSAFLHFPTYRTKTAKTRSKGTFVYSPVWT